jgi:pimeloyl-ACP methyl ester carboxylesterase
MRYLEAFREPIVHRRRNLPRIVRPTLQFPEPGTLLPGDVERPGEAVFGRRLGPIPPSSSRHSPLMRSYHKLIYFNGVDKGGHFAAWEEPEHFTAELRAAFRSQ